MRDAPNKPRRRSEADRQQMARFRRRHRSFDDHNMEAMRERWTTPATCSPPTTTTTLASAYSTRWEIMIIWNLRDRRTIRCPAPGPRLRWCTCG
ncbi:uncharacterized protein LOC124268980 isoform X2 [Haliotis rubra]|uniref:uncharacterized protein LOC124268980 isoform X2 n=1 Tax=Haliotis rubra TaxID=36100 RepID=UPI001EE613CD|nr:uncharacterized protein LOC124268980 isoform X2 [Haliotis rubra]